MFSVLGQQKSKKKKKKLRKTPSGRGGRKGGESKWLQSINSVPVLHIARSNENKSFKIQVFHIKN